MQEFKIVEWNINGYSQFVVGSGFPESAFKATATLDRT